MKKLAVLLLLLTIFLPHKGTSAGIRNIASWYGGGEKLNPHTANGDPFNSSLLTCATWDYPFDTLLKVINVKTGKSVIVRVNDRGPAKSLGRTIDLTKAAFSRIADTRHGLTAVRVEKL